MTSQTAAADRLGLRAGQAGQVAPARRGRFLRRAAEYNWVGGLLGLIVAVAYGLWRRLVTRPQRLPLSFEGILILLWIAALMVSDLLGDAALFRVQPELPEARWAFVSRAFSPVWAGLPAGEASGWAQGLAWTHIVLILGFLNYLPYGKHFHVITALPATWLKRLTPPAAADPMEFEGRESFVLKVVVPVTSLCPCSKEISDYGAHNQRSHVTIRAELLQEIPWAELVRFAEDSASSEIWPMLKRADEKWVTERAYENPKFVEDLVRDVALRLNADARVGRYSVDVENFESIHAHSAVARIERN